MAFEILQTVVTVAAAAGTTVAPIGEVPVREAEGTFNVDRVVLTTPTAVTGNGTNSITVNVRQLRAGASLATVATVAFTAGVNTVAEAPFPLTVSGTPQVLAGDLLEAQFVQIGTGLALPAGSKIGVELS